MNESIFDQNRKDSYFRAKKRVDRIKGFYKHLAIYIIINIFLLVLKYFKDYDFNDNFWRWETFNVVFFWGIGLAIHFINVFGFNFILGKKWEEQKIKELMDNDKYNN
ncbi:MAG: 2TM domain-containing protein [Bacteroidetes bacterium]|nr:2TM domain-containing protein [Bacteroidota bacterium]